MNKFYDPAPFSYLLYTPQMNNITENNNTHKNNKNNHSNEITSKVIRTSETSQENNSISDKPAIKFNTGDLISNGDNFEDRKEKSNYMLNPDKLSAKL